MGKKSSPAPDIVGAAETEGEFSRETVRDQSYAQNADQYNALGNSQWSQELVTDPASGEQVTKWVNNQTLSPAMERQFDLSNNTNINLGQKASDLTGRVNSEMSAPLNWDQFGDGRAGPEATTSAGRNDLAATTSVARFLRGAQNTTDAPQTITGDETFSRGAQNNINAPQTTTGADAFNWSSDNRGRAEDAAYARSAQRLDPRFAKEKATMETQMANRGLRAGDAAYDSAMETFNTGKNDAYEMARLGATGEGRAEDNQSYNQATGAWGTNRQTEQQRYNQDAGMYDRGQQAEQQTFNQDRDSFGINRQVEQQRFNQDTSAFNTGQQAEQQTFNQDRDAWNTNLQTEQQRFNQNRGVQDARLQIEQQAFNQGTKATNQANALRSQKIQEYLGKRGQSLKEQNALRDSQTTGETISNFGSGD